MTHLVVALLLAHAGGWSELPRKNAPPPLSDEATYYVGRRLIVIGRGQSGIEGSMLDLDHARWTLVRPLPAEELAPSAFPGHLPRAEVVGDELIFFFGLRAPEPGNRPRPFATGARFNIRRNRWRPIRVEGSLPGAGASFVDWSGGRLVVFRAPVVGAPLPEGGVGAVYDPTTDHWTPIASEGAPATDEDGALWHGALVGSQLVLFGRAQNSRLMIPKDWSPQRSLRPEPTGNEPGFLDFSYDFDTRSWRRLPPGAPRSRTMVVIPHGKTAWVLGGPYEVPGLEGGELDPRTGTWRKTSFVVGGAELEKLGEWAIREGCHEGRDEAMVYVIFDPTRGRWSVSRQRTFQCGNLISHDERVVLLLESLRARTGEIPVHLLDPASGKWRSGTLPTRGGPTWLGEVGTVQYPAMWPDHLHWDGRRIITWGGANVLAGPDACDAKPGPNPACAMVTDKPVRHTGYWVTPRWR